LDSLEHARLCMSAIQVASGDGRPDRVLRQMPHAGAMVEAHRRVTIVVSPSGPSGSVVAYSVRGCTDTVEYAVEPGG